MPDSYCPACGWPINHKPSPWVVMVWTEDTGQGWVDSHHTTLPSAVRRAVELDKRKAPMRLSAVRVFDSAGEITSDHWSLIPSDPASDLVE